MSDKPPYDSVATCDCGEQIGGRYGLGDMHWEHVPSGDEACSTRGPDGEIRVATPAPSAPYTPSQSTEGDT